MSVSDILKELNKKNGSVLNPIDKKKKTTFMDYEPGNVPKKETWSTPEYKKKATVTDDFLEGFNFYDDESSPQIETPISKVGSIFKENSRTTAETLEPVNAIGRNMTPPKAVNLPYYFGNEKEAVKLPFRTGNNLTGAKYPQPDEFIKGLNYYDDEQDGFKLFSYNANASEKGQELYPALYTQTQSSEPEKNYITDDMDINPKHGKAFGLETKKKMMGDIVNVLLNVYDAMDDCSPIPQDDPVNRKRKAINRENNEKIDLSEYYKKDKYGNISYNYITNQNRGAVAGLRYGNNTMNKNGCGAIAVYNSLITLGMPEDIRDIAADFEGEGQVFGGTFGTNPKAVKRYFEKHNCDVSVLESSDIINKKTPDADTYILVYLNNANNIMDGAHFVSIEKRGDKYRIYNYGGALKYIETDSIQNYLTNEAYVPVSMTCINRR